MSLLIISFFKCCKINLFINRNRRNVLKLLLFSAKANKGLEDVFHDPDIIQLLNNELIICFKMIPESASFENFNKICILY